MKNKRAIDSGNNHTIQISQKLELIDKNLPNAEVDKLIIIELIIPKWSLLIKSLDKFSNDFMTKRIQPKLEKRMKF
ncbi:MAG: hypothetical protein ABI638_02205 [Ignavibacteriota bacterium]